MKNSSYYSYRPEKGFSGVDVGLFLESQNTPVKKILPVNMAFGRVTPSGLPGRQNESSCGLRNESPLWEHTPPPYVCVCLSLSLTQAHREIGLALTRQDSGLHQRNMTQ